MAHGLNIISGEPVDQASLLQLQKGVATSQLSAWARSSMRRQKREESRERAEKARREEGVRTREDESLNSQESGSFFGCVLELPNEVKLLLFSLGLQK